MVFLVMVLLTFVYPVFMESYGTLERGILFSSYLGIILMGMGYIAFGTFISSLTENQIIAAVTTMVGGLFFWIIGWAASPSNAVMNAVFSMISFLKHFQNFARGLVDTTDIIYYGLFAFFCLFLTAKVLESNKWRG
jgi:ABC-2 type transport system permease protein